MAKQKLINDEGKTIRELIEDRIEYLEKEIILVAKEDSRDYLRECHAIKSELETILRKFDYC